MNPVEMAKQIRENGGSVPGVRSEKLEEYLTKVLNRIVLPGSLFLLLSLDSYAGADVLQLPCICCNAFRWNVTADSCRC